MLIVGELANERADLPDIVDRGIAQEHGAERTKDDDGWNTYGGPQRFWVGLRSYRATTSPRRSGCRGDECRAGGRRRHDDSTGCLISRTDAVRFAHVADRDRRT